MHLAESELYDILRDELLARMAMQMLVPRNFATPDQIWEQHQKLTVTAELDVVPLSVEDFVGQVREPKNDELVAYFEAYRDVFPGQTAIGAPGFRQPRRISIGYFEADYESIEAEVAEVTDEEIQKFYDERKDTFYRINTIPDQEPKPGDSAPVTPNADDAKPTTPDSTQNDAAKMKADPPAADKKPAAEKPAAEKPAAEKPAAEKKTTAEKKDADKKAASGPSPEPSPAAAVSKPPEEASKTDTTKKDGAPGSDEKKASKPSPAGDAAKAPATAEQPKAKPAAKDAQKPATPAMPAKAAEAPEKAADTETVEKDDKAPRYRALDDDLKSEIRDQLLRERTFEEMKTRIGKAMLQMQDIGRFYSAPKDAPERLSADQIDVKMKAYAEKNGLHYRTIKPLSGRELQDSEDYPIGNATEPVSNQFEARGAATVVQLLFGTDSEQLYIPQEAEDSITSSRFAFWPVRIVAEHTPKFDDEGIEEQVLKAWKLDQARPKAEERAKALAEAIEKAGDEKDIAKALTDETITGEKESGKLSVRSTPPFAWYTRTTPSTPQLNPFAAPREAPVRFSTIPGVENAGNDFMETVFESSQGDVRTAFNADKSICYVVKVKARTPVGVDGEGELRTQFMEEGVFASRAHQFLAQQEQQMTNYRWGQQFMMKYGIRWNRSRDKDEK